LDISGKREAPGRLATLGGRRPEKSQQELVGRPRVAGH